MCCVMGYTGHDLSAEKFKEYLLRTVDRGPDDHRKSGGRRRCFASEII